MFRLNQILSTVPAKFTFKYQRIMIDAQLLYTKLV